MNLNSVKGDLIIEICKKLNANTYLSGSLGSEYLNYSSFKENKIKLLFETYNFNDLPEYKLYKKIPSIIHYFFNYNIDEILSLINKCTHIKND